MKFSLTLLLLTACAYTQVHALNFSIPFYGKVAISKVDAQNTVAIKNDLVDATNFLEIDETDETVLQNNIAAAKLAVNGHVIPSGETVQIPLNNDVQCTFTITIRGNACAPYFQPKGLLKFLARFISVDISFTHTQTSDSEDELSTLEMLVGKIDQWESSFPHIKVRYRPLLAAQIMLTDAAHKKSP